jgi:hypothetical protein
MFVFCLHCVSRFNYCQTTKNTARVVYFNSNKPSQKAIDIAACEEGGVVPTLSHGYNPQLSTPYSQQAKINVFSSS